MAKCSYCLDRDEVREVLIVVNRYLRVYERYMTDQEINFIYSIHDKLMEIVNNGCEITE